VVIENNSSATKAWTPYWLYVDAADHSGVLYGNVTGLPRQPDSRRLPWQGRQPPFT